MFLSPFSSFCTYPITLLSTFPGGISTKNLGTKISYSDTHEGDASIVPYPDIFYLNIGSTVNLDGLILLSQNDGWPLNYTVEISLNGASWALAATVQLSNVVLRFIRFDNGPLNVKQLRINVTAAIGGFTRIAELSPIYAAAASSKTANADPLSTSTTSSATTTPLSSSSQSKSNAVGIIAGVLGGAAGILLAALGYFLWLLRKQKNKNIGTAGVKEAGDGIAIGGTQKSPVSGSSYHPNIASELGGRDPQEAGGYPRNELA